MAKPIAVTDADFEQQVLKAEQPVLVDFWATWCGPCRMVAPVLEQIAEEAEGKLTVAKMDVDQNQNIPSRFGIRSIPTMMLFKGGEHVDTIVGYKPKQALLTQLGKHVEGIAPAR
jgi:thioredoxin 1